MSESLEEGKRKKSSWSRLMQLWRERRRVSQFVSEDLWTLQRGELPGWLWRAVRALRIVLLALRRSLENSVQIRASALTYYTLMSLVPVAVLAFGLARGFGLEEALQRLVQEQLSDYPLLAERTAVFADRLLAHIGKGVITGVGIVVLLWTVVKVFINIERSFNAIWQVDATRSVLRRFTDYLAMIIVMPVVIIAATSANVVLKTYLQSPPPDHGIISVLSPMILLLLRVGPSLLVTLVFCLLYAVIPNTKVKPLPAIVAGLVAGVGFVALQWGYFTFQVGVSKYNAIYGSLAALPLLMVWLRLSWQVILIGAELSYAIQNVHLYESEARDVALKPRQMKELSLLLLTSVAGSFVKGKKAYTAEELSERHSLPLRLTHRLLRWMEEAQLVVQVEERNGVVGWHPQRSLDHYTARLVFDSFDENGQTVERRDAATARIEQIYSDYLLEGARAEVPLQNLAEEFETLRGRRREAKPPLQNS